MDRRQCSCNLSPQSMDATARSCRRCSGHRIDAGGDETAGLLESLKALVELVPLPYAGCLRKLRSRSTSDAVVYQQAYSEPSGASSSAALPNTGPSGRRDRPNREFRMATYEPRLPSEIGNFVNRERSHQRGVPTGPDGDGHQSSSSRGSEDEAAVAAAYEDLRNAVRGYTNERVDDEFDLVCAASQYIKSMMQTLKDMQDRKESPATPSSNSSANTEAGEPMA
ncbi:uncharacterized protein LOC108675415 [Hyalella azteca]|uniref:Uncharacterized protein LOC108675415 n=1 Tax=Hyalella azteca TaxID=294128 RepID=A0A8B7NYT9_HYAAZ|nr:uncharacterized protein LOC108675415 [Hyalella azteca]